MATGAHDPLRQFPFFNHLPTRVLKRIARVVDEVTVPKGTVIFEQGKVGYEFVLIMKGEVRVERDGEVVNHLFANDFFGEIAMIDKKPCSATVIAETDMRLLVVGRWHFDHLLEMTPGLWRAFATAMCKYARGETNGSSGMPAVSEWSRSRAVEPGSSNEVLKA